MNNKISNMLKACRLCCANEGTIALFTNTANLTPFLKFIYCCDKSKVNIEESDSLPKHICLRCDTELSLCYNFILKCVAADKKFRSLEVVQDVEHCSDLFQYIYENNNDNEVTNALPAEKEEKNSEHKLKKKQRKNLNKEPVECSICGKFFLYKSMLLQHIRIHSDQRVFKCSMCDKRYKHNSTLKLHQNFHKTRDISESRSKMPVDMTQTRRLAKQNQGPRECPVCHKICLNNSLLVNHLRTHTDIRSFKCTLCDKSYKDSVGLKRHEKSHLGSKNVVCDCCGKCLVSKTSLKIHKRIHTGETPFACICCPAKFSQRSSLTIHERRHHTGIKPFQCIQCKKKFVSRHELKKHFAVHSTERNYSCTICTKRFKFKTTLKKHMEIHGRTTKFTCDYCGFTCNHKMNLATHISRMHSATSGFCNVCLKQEANITEHMSRHNGYRPFKCEYCSSTFLNKRGLQYHVGFKHTKSDKYKCDRDGCGASFPSKPMLNFHNMKVHATVAPISCEFCSRSFYRKSDYARHKIGTHKQKLDNV